MAEGRSRSKRGRESVRPRRRSKDAVERRGKRWSNSGEVGRFAKKVPPMTWSEWTRWWTLYLFVLIPVRIIFGVLLPPLLHYVWHNGSFLHLAQDDHPVYAKVRLVGCGLRYGPHVRETMDILVPDPTKECLGKDGSSWMNYFEALAKTLFDVLTCYPRAILSKVSPRYFGFDNSHHRIARQYPALVFIHGGTSQL
jgi:hypothetical protein